MLSLLRQNRILCYIHVTMDRFFTILAILVVVLFLLKIIVFKKRALRDTAPLPQNFRSILEGQVDFYGQLSVEKKQEFEKRMMLFLSGVKITGIKTTVEDLDKVLIAASALIPIFAFPDWEYPNLNEILLYPGSFNDSFEHEGPGRDTLGLVGSGAYQNIMILSQQHLREDFANRTGKTNTAVHEFVHLIDKTDGEVNGVPESLLSRQYVLPWIKMIHEKIKQIMEENSDINPYGATNEAEFFAVAAEYFFERPDLLQENHPELYDMLVRIFRQQPVITLQN